MSEHSALKAIVTETAQPLTRRTLAQDAADALRKLILLEKLQPGMAVPERELAEGLGISRTPLREALRLLELEGLIEYSATRRPRVADPSLEELSQNLALLGALEGLAGEEACKNASNAEIERANALNRLMVETSDTAEPLDFFEADMAFHRSIVEASHNTPLIETHGHSNARVWRARFISSRRRPNRQRTLDQHGEIAEALIRRDGEACAKALKNHLKTAIANIRNSVVERGQDPEGSTA